MIARLCLGFVLPDSFQTFLCIRVRFRCICYFSLVCYPDWSLLIVVAPPVVWVSAATSWASGTMVAGELVRVVIVACVNSKAFSAFIQDTTISWDVDELYSTILFSINGGYWGVSSEAYIGVVLSSGCCWDPDGFNLCWSFCLQNFCVRYFFLLVSVREHLGWFDLECSGWLFESLKHNGFRDLVSQSISENLLLIWRSCSGSDTVIPVFDKVVEVPLSCHDCKKGVWVPCGLWYRLYQFWDLLIVLFLLLLKKKYLNDSGRITNLVLPVADVALDGVMCHSNCSSCSVNFFYEVVSEVG